jgi:hypothetical protein
MQYLLHYGKTNDWCCRDGFDAAAMTSCADVRVTVTTGTCEAPGDVAHSLWTRCAQVTTVQQPRHGRSEASCQRMPKIYARKGLRVPSARAPPEAIA